MIDHLEFRILLAIRETQPAMKRVSDCAVELEDIFGRFMRKASAPSEDEVAAYIAYYIARAIEWNSEIEPSVVDAHDSEGKGERDDAGDATPKVGAKAKGKAKKEKVDRLSRRRVSLIKQLRFIDKQMTDKKARLRIDRPITPDVLEALARRGALGRGLLSLVRHQSDEPVPEAPAGVEGAMTFEAQARELLERHDPFHMSEDVYASTRNIQRHLTREERAGRVGKLRADAIVGELPHEVWGVFAAADRFEGKESPSLKDVKSRLDEEDMRILGEHARAVAQELQLEFAMLNLQTENNSSETTVSFARPYPLAQFVHQVFKLVAPIAALETEISGQDVRYDLEDHAIAAGLAWAQYARLVLDDIADRIRALKIDVDPQHLNDPSDRDDEVPLDDVKLGKKHYLDCGARVMEKSEAKRREEGRMMTGRRRILRDLWRTRDDAIKLLGFTELMYWYHERLLDAESPLLDEFTTNVLNPIRAWYKELMGRYWDGTAFPKELKRRASGVPLEIPKIPSPLRKHQMVVVRPPGSTMLCAQRDDKAIRSLLKAFDDGGEALRIWRSASQLVDKRWPHVW